MAGPLIPAHSEKQGAAPTFKKGYGFHPLGAWLANTAESLAMLLRPGNAGSDTFADHLAVLTAAIRQIPSRMRSRLLVRVDGGDASHELITHLLSLASTDGIPAAVMNDGVGTDSGARSRRSAPRCRCHVGPPCPHSNG